MKASRKLSFELMFFTAFFATLPVYSPNMFVFQDGHGTDAQMQLFVPTLLASVLVTCIVTSVLSAKGHDNWASSKTFTFISTILYIAGCLAFSLQVFGNEMNVALIVVSAIVLALGTTGLCISWGSLFSLLDMRQSMFYLALCIGLASAFQLVLQILSPDARLLIFDVLVVVGSVPLLFMDSLTPLVHGNNEGVFETADAGRNLEASDSLEAREAVSSFEEEGFSAELVGSKSGDLLRKSPGTEPMFKRMAPLIATPLIGLMVFALLTGVRKFVIFDFFYVELMGGFLASLIVLIIGFTKTGRPLISLYFKLILPLFALVLIILNSFPINTPPFWIAASTSYVFFSLVGILALVSICGIAHAREFRPTLIFSLTLGSYAAMSIVGVLCGSELSIMRSNGGGPVLLVISTIYFAFLVLMPILSGWRKEESADIPPHDSMEALSQRCTNAAKSGALSPRETEILTYIGRGHSVAFVAKTLVISESTVRTHAKNIYRKLGVTSREELIEYIDHMPADK